MAVFLAAWLAHGPSIAQASGTVPTTVLNNPSLEVLRQAFALEEPKVADRSGDPPSGAVARKPRLRSIVVDADTEPVPSTVLVAIPFQLNSASLSTESASVIDHLATVLREVSKRSPVVIEGHTDASGSAEFNRRLSLARAETVMRAMVARSVDPDRLVAEGHGADRPLAGRSPFDAVHRRVQFRVEGQH